MMAVFAVLALAWGVLAFGAVYPWAYWPLILLTAAIGGCGLLAGTHHGEPHRTALSLALGSVALVIVLQLLPLPASVLAVISPASDRLLRQYDLQYAMDVTLHPLSINPASTRLALACFVAFSMFSLGLARQLTTRQTIHLVHGIIALGLVVGGAGIVQKAAGVDRIYGFWEPYHHPYNIFGPFVNRNHYAGWMIMTLSVTLGYACGRIAGAMRDVRPGWRNRLLWFSSPAANQLILAAVSIPVMALALLSTLSRSGIGCLVVALVLGGWLILRRVPGRGGRRAIGMAYLIALVVFLSGWAGVDAVVERFSAQATDLQGRLGAWRDATHIVRDFPLAGTGVNTFGTAMIFYQSDGGPHWDAAHNDYVQLAAEGGVLLGASVALAIAMFVRRIRQCLREEAGDSMAHWLRVSAVIGLLAIGLQEMFDFSLQLPGNAVLFATLAAIAVRPPGADGLGSREQAARTNDASGHRRPAVLDTGGL